MKLDISEKQLVEFDIEIEGADSKEIKPRLMLHDKNYTLCFEGVLKNKKCIFNIPKLYNIVKNESVASDIEVIYNGKFYKPWSATIDIEKPVVFNVKENNEPKIKTEATPFKVNKSAVKISKIPKGLIKEEANEKAKQLVREFIKMWKGYKVNEQKKMMKVLNQNISEKWIKWGKQVFEDINNPKAKFILSALSTLNNTVK
jgi:hypothetical protein